MNFHLILPLANLLSPRPKTAHHYDSGAHHYDSEAHHNAPSSSPLCPHLLTRGLFGNHEALPECPAWGHR